jgi:hypothetical protein
MKIHIRVLAVSAALMSLYASAGLSQDVPVGTYTVNYRSNCAGLYTDQSQPDYTKANPYFGNSIAPGPIFIDAAPGDYKLVVVSGGGCAVWSGDATNGAFSVTGHAPGDAVTVHHSAGQIALYYWDWFAGDNDPAVQTTVAVYRVVPFSLSVQMYAGVTVSGNPGSSYEIQYTTGLARTNWLPLQDITLTTNSFLYFDTGSSSTSQRFYRVIAKP